MGWVTHQTASPASHTPAGKAKQEDLLGTVVHMVIASTAEHESGFRVAGKNKFSHLINCIILQACFGE